MLPSNLSQQSPKWPAPARAWTTIAILWLAYFIAYIDRLGLAIMADRVKLSLGLSDTQIGLLLGFGFALVYTVCAFPAARLADRYGRVRMLAIGLLVWGASTALAGFADGFNLLLVSRIGVGVGESVMIPAAMSIIADSFPPDKRATPIGVFSSASSIGMSAAFALVGWLLPISASLIAMYGLAHADWQITFFMIALPTLLTAGLMVLIAEPARQGIAADTGERGTGWFAHLGTNWKDYASIVSGPALMAMFILSMLSWLPSLLQRKHGMTTAEAGSALGIIALIGSILAPFIAAKAQNLSTRPERNDGVLNGQLALLLLTIPFGLLIPLAPTSALTLVGFCGMALFAIPSMILPQVGLQQIAPPHFRASVAAIWVVTSNILGIGCGPALTAFISDMLASDGARIDDALLLTGIISFSAALLLTLATRRHGLALLARGG